MSKPKNVTFHIPQRDEPMWAAVDRMAERHQTSRYRLVADAIEAHLTRLAAEPTPRERWANLAADAA